MSSSPSTHRTSGSSNYSSPSSRMASRNTPSPSGTRPAPVGPMSRQVGVRTAARGTSSRDARSPQASEQRTQRDQTSNESLQELRELMNVQEVELLRLRNEARENEDALAESQRESQILRQNLEDARLEQHRLEDELELRREEIERMNNQIRENQKSKMESQKLAENEQQRLLEEKEVMVRSNSELSAQLKALRNSLQSGRSRDTSPAPREKDPADVSESSSYGAAIREKDRQIDLLRLELADLEVRLAEQANSALSRSRQIEDELLRVKLENIRLAENVESYQILLQDRTLKGEYSIMSVEGMPEKDETNSSRSTSPFYDEHKSKGTTLATELEEAEISAHSTKIKALQAEIRHLKDSNKAMGLYINEIIGRLLQTKGFEHVLEKDANKMLPAPLVQDRRPIPGRASMDAPPRRNFVPDNPAPAPKRVTSTAETSITGGLSRAFSFRRKPESSTAIANLRPLKLVEEQQPQASLRSDGTLSYTRSRTHNDDSDETSESRAAKRASWVPGWFAKGGVAAPEEKQ